MFHSDIPEYIFDIVDESINKTYCDIIDYSIYICQKCGGVDHEEYNDECLFRSEKLRHKYLNSVEA